MGLGHDIVYNTAMYIGETEIASAIMKRKFFMVQTEQMEQRGMVVMDVHLLIYRIKPIIIAAAVAEAWLYSTAGKPIGKSVGIMIAAVVALRRWRAAKFGSPNYQCFIE